MSVTVDTRPPAGVPSLDRRAPDDPTPVSSLRSEDVDMETSRSHYGETGPSALRESSRPVAGKEAPLTTASSAGQSSTLPHPSRQSDSQSSNTASEEAAALLLNFSAVGDHPPPPVAGRSSQPRLDQTVPSSTYPNTPPHDSPIHSHDTTNVPAAPSSPTSIPTPAAASPETQSKPVKSKRKRNAVAGPSRQSSSEPERPHHWMGEDNAVIRCICGFTEDDGFTIQCEGCNTWEHGLCFGYQDEASVPDTYFCELCMPRKVDADRARALQAPRIAYSRLARPAESSESGKKSRPKSKRQRTERTDRTTEEASSGGGNNSTVNASTPGPAPVPPPAEDSSSMAPPNSKPKRKAGPSQRPRKESRHHDTKEEDDYFRVLPWEMEYTPIKDNIIRGVPARHAMTQLYREWIDVDESTPPRKGRSSYHDSGLPSPTETGVLRLSPDNMFTSPDFSILGPPVPPATLSGSDLSSLAASTSIRPVDDNHCFLPLKYIEPSSGIYARPTLYGLFVNEAVQSGGFLGEYRGEIIDSASYRKDPINQYSALGIPKPYVHSVGPPVNLMLDARSYGCDTRFVRSGCHPNAVVRPLLFRSDDDQKPKLRFGIFASRDLSKNEEIVLGWEWDDQHVVHTLRAVIDSTLKAGSSAKAPIAPETLERLALKFDSILTNIFGTFQSCACTVTTDCAFSQMRRLVSGQAFHGVSGSRARKRIDLGELIGAVRGWRRRELETVEAAKARRFASSGEWELWRTGPNKSSSDDEAKPVDSTPSRPASSAEQSDPGMEVDEPPAVEESPPVPGPAQETAQNELQDDDETEDELPPPEAAAPTSVPEPEPVVAVPAEEADSMVGIESSEATRSAGDSTTAKEESDPITATDTPPAAEPDMAPTTAQPTEDVATEEAEPTPVQAPMTVDDAAEPATANSKPEAEVTAKEEEEEEEDKDGMKTPVPQRTADTLPEQPSSVLSSLPSDQIEHAEAEGEEELSGNESEATTVTVVRSEPSDNDSGSEDIHPPTIRRGRRVVSPVAEASTKRADKSKGKAKARSTKAPEPSRHINKRRSRKNVIASSDEGSSADEAPSSFQRRAQRPSPSKPTKKSLIRKAPQSDSDLSDEAEKENQPKSRKVESRKPNSSKKAKLDRDTRDSSKASVRGPSPHSDPKAEKPRSKGKSGEEDAKPVRSAKATRKVIPASPPPDEEKGEATKMVVDDAKDTSELPSAKAKASPKMKESLKAHDNSRPQESERKAMKSKETSKERSPALELSPPKESEEQDAAKDPSPPPTTTLPTTETSVPAKNSTPPAQGLTPPPKELGSPVKDQTTPPREPSPSKEASVDSTPPKKEAAAAPPKKVSMKEYLATHKIRKVSHQSESTDASNDSKSSAAETKDAKDAGENKVPNGVKEAKDSAEEGATSADRSAARLNLLEHLPSTRPTSAGTTPTTASPFSGPSPTERSASGQSAAYVPRTDYLGNGPSSAASSSSTSQSNYVPRPSPSYVPRSLPEDSPSNVGGSFTSPSNAYVPRESFPPDPSLSPVAPRHSLPHQTPPRTSQHLPDMPPPLAQRDGPPHYRAPPTGPRAVPTGPRGSWSGHSGGPPHPSGNGPVSPVAPLRGNYPPRGGFSGRGGGFSDRPRGYFGGRGGYRGRGRGM